MEQAESVTHSFIVKIWLEETRVDNREASWRGHITHVPGGERRYLQNLDEIDRFIEPYLAKMGVRRGFRERVREYFGRQK